MCVGKHGVHTEFGEQLAGVGSSFPSTTWAPGIELRATALGLCHFCFCNACEHVQLFVFVCEGEGEPWVSFSEPQSPLRHDLFFVSFLRQGLTVYR